MEDQLGDFEQLKSKWNLVLDSLLEKNRVAWIAYFDGRLVSLESGILTISFIDADKFIHGHSYESNRSENMRNQLELSIKEVTGYEIKVVEK